MIVHYAIRSHLGNVRKDNQDAVAMGTWLSQGPQITADGSLRLQGTQQWTVCVLDGMGGYQGGALAALMGAASLCRGLEHVHTRSEPSAFTLAYDHTSEAVRALAEQSPALSGMGATAAAIVLDAGHYVVTNVGDVNVYRLWTGQYLSQLTIEDRPITSSHLVSQALGHTRAGQLEAHHYAFPTDDATVLLMCTDGLTDAISDEQIKDILTAATRQDPDNAAGAAQDLVTAALAAGGPDNVTVVVITFRDTNQDTNQDIDQDTNKDTQ